MDRPKHPFKIYREKKGLNASDFGFLIGGFTGQAIMHMESYHQKTQTRAIEAFAKLTNQTVEEIQQQITEWQEKIIKILEQQIAES